MTNNNSNPRIIFDVFGVLLTSGFSSAAPRLADKLKRPVKEIKPVYERWEKPFDLGIISACSFWARVQEELGTEEDWYQLDSIVLEGYEEIPGSFELLERCSRRTSVYVLSNTRQEWFEFLDAKFGITRRVKQAYLSYEIGYVKPDVRCYNAVVSAIGCPPSDLVFIDDRVGNVVAARKLGITSILFKNAQAVESKLKELYPELFPSRDIGSVDI